MQPVLFRIGPVLIYSWGAGVILVMIAGMLYVLRRARKMGVSGDMALNVGIMALLCATAIGAIGIVSNAALQGAPLDQLMKRYMFDLRGGSFPQIGVTIVGMAPGAALGILVSARVWHIPVFTLGDIFAPALLPMLAIFRIIGCFLAGCCFGMPTESAWGVVYPWLWQITTSPFPKDTPVLPSPLIETCLLLAGWAAICWYERQPHFPGAVFWSVGLCAPAIRFVSDQFRYYDSAALLTEIGGIKLYQHHGALLLTFLVSLGGWLYGYTRRSSSPGSSGLPDLT